MLIFLDTETTETGPDDRLCQKLKEQGKRLPLSKDEDPLTALHRKI